MPGAVAETGLVPGSRVLVGGGYTSAYARLVDTHPFSQDTGGSMPLNAALRSQAARLELNLEGGEVVLRVLLADGARIEVPLSDEHARGLALAMLRATDRAGRLEMGLTNWKGR